MSASNMTSAHDDVSFEIETVKQFDFFGESFSKLHEASNATAFQGPLWLDQFYKTLVPALGAEPLIVKITLNGAATPSVIIPLVRERHRGVKIVQPADLGVSDYNSVVGTEQDLNALAQLPDFGQRLVAALKPFDIVLFRKQRPDGFDVGHLFDGAQNTPNISSAYETIAGADFDAWFKTSVSKNMRKGLRRKKTGFERDFGELSFQEVTSPEDIEAAFRAMQAMRAARFETDLLSQDPFFGFYKNVATSGAQQGIASTFIGKCGEDIVTVEFGLRHKGRFMFLLGSFLEGEEYKKFSLGLLSLNEKIHQEAEQGQKIFDFTIGDEAYKLSFAAEKVPLVNTTVTSGLIGNVAFNAYNSRGPVRNILKKIVSKFN